MNHVRLGLKSLGYHEVLTGKWLKPVGYHMFAFIEATMQWENWYLDGNNELSIWKTIPLIDSETFWVDLRECEVWGRHNISASSRSDFRLKCFDL